MNLVHLIGPLVVIPYTKSKNQARHNRSSSMIQVRVKTLKGF